MPCPAYWAVKALTIASCTPAAQVFVISSQRIQQRGYDTLFKHATKNKRSLFGAVVLKFPGKLQVRVLGPGCTIALTFS